MSCSKAEAQMINTSGLKPYEFNVVVQVREKQEQTTGGVFLPDMIKDREEIGGEEGVLVALSPAAFDFVEWSEGVTLPKVGDRIMFKAYTGQLFRGKDGKRYRVMKDKDIIGVLDGDFSWEIAA